MMSSSSTRARAAGRAHCGRRATAAVAVAVALLVAACGPTAEPPATADPLALVARIGDGSIELTWQAQAGVTASGYDVQVRTESGGWADLATVTTTSVTFEDPQSPTAYHFRVRTAAGGTALHGAWSPPLRAVYVDPVLPIVRIDTVGSAPILDRENYVPATMVLDPNGSGVAPYSGTLGIRGRGNSTWQYDKKPFRLKLDAKSPLMGMSSNRDWALLANALDRSQLRTFTAGRLSEATDLAWTPGYRYVEVVLNGQYQGVYVLAEHVKIGGDRIDIDEMDEGDVAGDALTGGYLLEIDTRLESNGEPGFRTRRGMPIVIKDPEPAEAAQLDYVKGYVQAFEDALYAPDFADPATGYRQYLDVDSLVDWYLVQELTRNHDAMWSSSFIHKPRGGLLTFGPIWDFDLSMGTSAGLHPMGPEGWHVRRAEVGWIPRLFQDPAFAQRVVERWDQLVDDATALADHLEEVGAGLAPAIDHDELRWRYALAPNDQPGWVADWLRARIAWIDAELHPEG